MAAWAAIGAAAKELRLPTVRKEALRLAWSGRDAADGFAGAARGGLLRAPSADADSWP